MKSFWKLTTIISTIIVVILWFNACIYLCIAAHFFYPNSLYAVCNTNKSYTHAYLIIDNVPADPQRLFLSLSPTVDYNNPIFTTNSTTELLNRTYTWSKFI